jgi:hypothetical protein
MLFIVSVLLQENARLSEEKRVLERQTSVKREELVLRMTEVQEQLEDQQLEHERAFSAQLEVNTDLNRQLEAQEKQLRANRQFLEVGSFCHIENKYS